jgi:hypothetical protein
MLLGGSRELAFAGADGDRFAQADRIEQPRLKRMPFPPVKRGILLVALAGRDRDVGLTSHLELAEEGEAAAADELEGGVAVVLYCTIVGISRSQPARLWVARRAAVSAQTANHNVRVIAVPRSPALRAEKHPACPVPPFTEGKMAGKARARFAAREGARADPKPPFGAHKMLIRL